MKHKIIKTVFWICLALILIFTGSDAYSQESKISLNALITDIQKSTDNTNEMIMVWWIPEEFWVAALSGDPSISQSQINMITETLRPYLILIVVEGNVGNFGGVTYKAESTIRDHLKVVDKFGDTYNPLTIDQVDLDTQNLLGMMKPVLVNMLGPMGQNMHFFLFNSNSSKGQIANPNKEGMFSVHLGGNTFNWRLPLGSLLPQKLCAKCNEKLSGAYSYCPYCGGKL